MNIAVAGAGIGGLTLARALLRHGHSVQVFERHPALPAVGAGIVLAPNAMGVFDTLGIGDTLRARGRLVSRFAITNAQGTELQALPNSGAITIHRGALLETLADQVPITFNTPIGAFNHHEDHVVLDGRRWDWLVGADGIGSSVRASLGHDTTRRFAGQTCWRFVSPLQVQEDCEERWGDGIRVGLIPLLQGTYVFLVATAEAGSPRQPTEREALAARFAALHPEVPALLQALGDGPLLHHDLEDHATLEFGRGRVALLGDAAHALTPNMGQGAGMSIEDALVLARCLEGDRPLPTYEARRRPRVHRVWRDSRRIGAVGHLRSPVLRWLRDTALRATPQSLQNAQVRWLYDGI